MFRYLPAATLASLNIPFGNQLLNPRLVVTSRIIIDGPKSHFTPVLIFSLFAATWVIADVIWLGVEF